MPISAIDGLSEGHWKDVNEILSSAIGEAGFKPFIVSNADEIGVIHKRIFQNLYELPIVICDVSCNNPNVMYELGMRIAFDKGVTIIVKDDETPFAKTFDTAPIEQLVYPRDLRHNLIETFMESLTRKITATWRKFESDDYESILSSFGKFQTVDLKTEEVSSTEYIVSRLGRIERLLTTDWTKVALDRKKSKLSVTVRWEVGISRQFISDNALASAIGDLRCDPAVRTVFLSDDSQELIVGSDLPKAMVAQLLASHGIPVEEIKCNGKIHI